MAFITGINTTERTIRMAGKRSIYGQGLTFSLRIILLLPAKTF